MGSISIWIGGVFLFATALTRASGLNVSTHWPLTGPVGWDYLTLNSAGTQLFVTRGTQVDVLDTSDGKVIGTITGTSGAHGVALAEDLQRGYISNGKSDTVTMFDLQTFKMLQTEPVAGNNPDAILYDRAGKHLFTFNGRSDDVSVLSPGDLKVLAHIKVPGKPEFAVDDGEGQIFVNIETEPGQMVVIDARRLAVKTVWPLPGCNSPSGLSLDKVHHRLFSVCDNKIMVVTDATTGKQVSRVSIGEGPDAVAYDPQRSIVVSSNGDGTLTVVHQDSPDRYRVVQSLATQKGSRTMALDASTGIVYLASARFLPGTPPESGRPLAAPESFAVLKITP